MANSDNDDKKSQLSAKELELYLKEKHVQTPADEETKQIEGKDEKEGEETAGEDKLEEQGIKIESVSGGPKFNPPALNKPVQPGTELGPKPINVNEDFRPKSPTTAQPQPTPPAPAVTAPTPTPTTPTSTTTTPTTTPSPKEPVMPAGAPVVVPAPQKPSTPEPVSNSKYLNISTPESNKKSAETNKLPYTTPEQDSNIDKEKPSALGKVFKIFLIIILLAGLGGGTWWYFLAPGYLNLTVNPPGATIQVDNNKTSDTKTKLKPGSHTLTVQKQGYVNYSKQINIKRLQTIQLSVELMKNPAPAKVSSTQISNFFTDKDGLVVLGNNGKTLYKIESETTTTNTSSSNSDSSELTQKAISPDNLGGIEDIIWHPKENLAIMKIKQNKAALATTLFANKSVANDQIMTYLFDFKRYDLVNQEVTFWGTDIGDIVWSPSGENIYYSYAPASGEKTLISASKNNQNLERLLNFKESKIENPNISISADGKYLLIVSHSSNYDSNEVYLFEIVTKQLTKLTTGGHKIKAKFSPNSQQILYTSYGANDIEPTEYSTLGVVNVTTKKTKALNARATTDRADFTTDSKYILAAVSVGTNKNDVFVKIDPETVAKTELPIEMSSTPPDNSKLIKPAKVIFIENKAYYIYLGNLYSLNLVNI
ncbi:MAG TPA: PEGA domain-containing protein [Patescibacteria group bacterium]|nr:PEGA domain-containing protein [Patescibacteria group bacterium]